MIQIYLIRLTHETYTNSHPSAPSIHCRYPKQQFGGGDENFPQKARPLISVTLFVAR